MSENKTDIGKPEDNENPKSESDVLAEQKRKDALLELERMRRWIEDGEPLPVRTACKISKHIVAEPKRQD